MHDMIHRALCGWSPDPSSYREKVVQKLVILSALRA